MTMKTKHKFSTQLIALVGAIMLLPAQALAAFGISPPWIVNENLKPGSSFVYVIDLNTNNPKEDQLVTTKVSGDPEISEWISIRSKDNLVMRQGEKHVPMYVELNVPSDAKLGKYKGTIAVKIEPKKPRQGEVTIALGGNIDVNLNVINRDVTDYVVKNITLDPVTVGNPLSLNLKVKNLGNTTIDSIPTSVELVDYESGEVVARQTNDKLNHLVYPHTVKDTVVSASIEDLPAGTYWANVDAKKDGKSVYSNRLYLTVGESSLSSTAKTTVQVTTDKRFLKPAAEEKMEKMDKMQEDSVAKVKTTVTVRAPLTNQLIGVVIALLIVLIILVVKISSNVDRKKRK